MVNGNGNQKQKKEDEDRSISPLVIIGSVGAALGLGLILFSQSQPSAPCQYPRTRDPNTNDCQCPTGFVSKDNLCIPQATSCNPGEAWIDDLQECVALATTGELHVTSNPDSATVIVNGRILQGLTPAIGKPPKIYTLQTGFYGDVRIQAIGYEEYVVPAGINIVQGMPVIIEANLVPDDSGEDRVSISFVNLSSDSGRNGDMVNIDVTVYNGTAEPFNGYVLARFKDKDTDALFFQSSEEMISLPAGANTMVSLSATATDMGIVSPQDLNLVISVNTGSGLSGQTIDIRELNWRINTTNPGLSCNMMCDETQMFLGCAPEFANNCVEGCPPGEQFNPTIGACDTPLVCSDGGGGAGVFDPMSWSCDCPPGTSYDEITDTCVVAPPMCCPTGPGEIEVAIGGGDWISISCSQNCLPSTQLCHYDDVGVPLLTFCDDFVLQGGESGTVAFYLRNNAGALRCVRSRAVIHELGVPSNVFFTSDWSSSKNISAGGTRFFLLDWTAPPTLPQQQIFDITIEVECGTTGAPVGSYGGFTGGAGFGETPE